MDQRLPRPTLWVGNSPKRFEQKDFTSMTELRRKIDSQLDDQTLTPADLAAVGAIVSERMFTTMMDTQKILARAEQADDSTTLRHWLIRLLQRRKARNALLKE